MKPYLIHVHERPLTLVKPNHDGDFFITCAKDGEVCLMRTEPLERVGTYVPYQKDKLDAVYAVDITMDCQHVVTAGVDGKLYFFKFTGELVNTLHHGGMLKFVEFNQKPGEQNMVVTCNDKFKSAQDGSVPNRIMIWRFDPWPAKRLLSIDEALPMKATKVKWGPFDETLVSIHEEGTVVVWSAETGEQLSLVQAHQNPDVVTGLNFSEDRMLMITCGKDKTAKLWAMDRDEPELIKTYKTDRPLNDAAISPLYNVEKDPKFHILMGGGQDAKDVTTTASSSGKFETLLYHMIYEEEIGSIKGHFGPMNTLAWLRDGRGFITGGEDGYVRVNLFDSDYYTKKPFTE